MVTVVTGPPCGGKSTYVRERAKSGDVVIDLDRMALALTTEGTPDHQYPRHVTTVAVAARRAAIDTALSLHGVKVWIIDTAPSGDALRRYTSVGAQIVTCDPGRDVVTERVDRLRPTEIARVVDDYYDGQLRKTTKLAW